MFLRCQIQKKATRIIRLEPEQVCQIRTLVLQSSKRTQNQELVPDLLGSSGGVGFTWFAADPPVRCTIDTLVRPLTSGETELEDVWE